MGDLQRWPTRDLIIRRYMPGIDHTNREQIQAMVELAYRVLQDDYNSYDAQDMVQAIRHYCCDHIPQISMDSELWRFSNWIEDAYSDDVIHNILIGIRNRAVEPFGEDDMLEYGCDVFGETTGNQRIAFARWCLDTRYANPDNAQAAIDTWDDPGVFATLVFDMACCVYNWRHAITLGDD